MLARLRVALSCCELLRASELLSGVERCFRLGFLDVLLYLLGKELELLHIAPSCLELLWSCCCESLGVVGIAGIAGIAQHAAVIGIA